MAVVKVTVETVDNVLSDEAPALTAALLPREKTYNVVAMMDNDRRGRDDRCQKFPPRT